MLLKAQSFNHEEEKFNKALQVDDYIMTLCKERILFTHFANALQSEELFGNTDDAPREMVTLTGDLKRTLNMITDPLEYELTLLWFTQYHAVAMEGFLFYKSNLSNKDDTKSIFLQLMMKIKAEQSDDTNRLDIHGITQRIEFVKKSKYNFNRYMELMGHPVRKYNDIDNLLNDVFKED